MLQLAFVYIIFSRMKLYYRTDVRGFESFLHFLTLLLSDVYERLVVKGKRPGFRQLLATQVVSAVWHVSTSILLNLL